MDIGLQSYNIYDILNEHISTQNKFTLFVLRLVSLLSNVHPWKFLVPLGKFLVSWCTSAREIWMLEENIGSFSSLVHLVLKGNFGAGGKLTYFPGVQVGNGYVQLNSL